MEVESNLQQIEGLLTSLSTSSAPPVLWEPRARALREVAGELRIASQTAAACDPDDAELCGRKAEVSKLLQQMAAEVAGEPWHNPPAQRRLLRLEQSLRDASEELSRLTRIRGPGGQFKFIRPVNMKDPEDVRVSGMAADPPPRVEPDRLGDHHGISAIILAASGDTTGRSLSDVFGPKAHCAGAIQRILHTMS
mmetsp:Transcript_17560/g.33033  ORF Transcript_17560/g.33033 Transcript_17560/m.33033 type:complete len:194 (+) Transcript_17560:73-654(+)